MAVNGKYLYILLACIVIAIAVFYYSKSTSTQPLPTYFTYTQAEIITLRSLHSDQEITVDALRKWDNIMFSLVKENNFGDAPASRVYAYLYAAQRDVAFLSYNIKNSFMGNIDYISAQTLCLFFEKNCSDMLVQTQKTDSYSKALADIVLNKIRTRREADKKNVHLQPEKPAAHYWAGIRPYYGADVGSWMPWTMQSVNKFVAPPPPAYDSPEWQHQLKITKDALANITPEQTKIVVFWAGNPGTVTPPGLWLTDANDYMFSHNIPLSKTILVRSVLTMAMADAVIAVFYSKYTYQIKRPFMLDPSIFTIMPTPNHPSYPAGHSTISAAAAAVLVYYFPEQRDDWLKKAYEASMGRIWGGIHFPIDAEQGTILGKRVGESAIIKENNKKNANEK